MKITSNYIKILVLLSAPFTLSRGDEAALQKQVDELSRIVKDLQQQITTDKAAAAASTVAAGSNPNGSSPVGGSSSTPHDTFKTAGGEAVTAEDLESVRDQLNDSLDRRLRVRNGVGVAINGSVIGRYTDQRVGQSAFTIPSASIGFSGSLRSDPVEEGDVRYVASFVYGQSSSAANTTRVSDAYVTWNLKSLGKKELEPAYTLALQLGQQAVFFGNDNVSGEELRPTINGAQYDFASTAAFQTRDIGLVASGGWDWHYDSAAPADLTYIPTLGYTLGVFNGNTVTQNGSPVVDDNDNKAILAKLVYAPFTKYNSFFQGLKIGASRLQWDQGRGKTGLTQRQSKDLNSVQLEWLKLPFLTTLEYVWGTSSPSTPGPDVHMDSVIATIFYRPSKLPDFEPLLRFDRDNTNDTLRKDGRRDVTTIGFNYYFWQVDPLVRRTYQTVKTERVLKLQVNYNIIRDFTPTTAAAATRPNDNQILAQVVFAF